MPKWWGEQTPYPTRPVMGVAWFEAMAYCRWLDARLRPAAPWMPMGTRCGWRRRRSGRRRRRGRPPRLVRLPSEADWEKACDGGGGSLTLGRRAVRRTRANIDEAQIGHTSAAGSFPAGATPCRHPRSGRQCVGVDAAASYQPTTRIGRTMGGRSRRQPETAWCVGGRGAISVVRPLRRPSLGHP